MAETEFLVFTTILGDHVPKRKNTETVVLLWEPN